MKKAFFENIIIGAGPTGLGAASVLEKANASWIILEKNSYVGGLAASFRHDGFQWDIGGHVIFSHYKRYDHLLDTVISEHDWIYHKRSAFVRFAERWVPYPFQYNLDFLPPDMQVECVESLLRLRRIKVHKKRPDFLTFIENNFGEAIARLFMVPYNEKVWAYPLDKMDTKWLGDRVPLLDVNRALNGSIENPENRDWGPNNTFRFPMKGGTGEIWSRLALTLPNDKINLNAEVTGISTSEHTLTLKDGKKIKYGTLINTMPLDQLITMSDMDELSPFTRSLHHTSTHVVGLGIQSDIPDHLRKFSWIYFPDKAIPFYRATVFSNYSPHNAIDGHWSLLLEVSESPYRKIDQDGLVDDCIRGCLIGGLIQKKEEVTHIWHHRVEYGYPVPCLERDSALEHILAALEENGILSRGRFGAWKYEVGNMDHSYMQGVEGAQRILTGIDETTLLYPEKVNGSYSNR